MSVPLIGDLTQPLDPPEDPVRALEGGLRWAVEAKASAILLSPSDSVLRVLAGSPSASLPEVVAVVPNMAEYVRDASDHGLMGAALVRLRRADRPALARVAWVSLTSVLGLVVQDVKTMLRLLLELELASLRRFRPKRIVLAAGLTDLALAAGNRAFFDAFCLHVRRFHGAEPCVETQNLGHLLRRFREWGPAIAAVLAPLNVRGYGMRPDLQTCLDELLPSGPAVWARDVTAGGTLCFGEGLRFAEGRGARAVVARPDEVGSPASSPEPAAVETNR